MANLKNLPNHTISVVHSTARSIGARSDFGDHDHEHDDEQLEREGSVAPMDEQKLREKEEADRHVAAYVSEQLHRVRSHDSYAGN
ncbi:hypothetical protein EYC84_000850 [Monilinia fructicola]|uniref:Uncharacterized protein n=1 Tax=Monilinia fructicola TaxID=38448 RepID=A0A5M9JIR9_MONFR|nr:hypothetical protein EYC84_000850 [Monilinia fructicola]